MSAVVKQAEPKTCFPIHSSFFYLKLSKSLLKGFFIIVGCANLQGKTVMQRVKIVGE